VTDPSAAASIIDTIVGRSQSATTALRVRSALNPMLWLCGIVSLPLLAGAWWAYDVQPLGNVLLFLGGLPIAATCVIFVYFALCRPQNLRSEEYQIRHEALELIRQKGQRVPLSPASVDAIANPTQQKGLDDEGLYSGVRIRQSVSSGNARFFRHAPRNQKLEGF
jgi:hypothetical protein